MGDNNMLTIVLCFLVIGIMIWAGYDYSYRKGRIEGIERGKYVYVVDVHQPKVWADGIHDDSEALQMIIDKSSLLNEGGMASIIIFSGGGIHKIEKALKFNDGGITFQNIWLQGSDTGIIVRDLSGKEGG